MIKLVDLLNEADVNKCPAATQNIELNLTNRGQFNASQAPSETEEQFLRRLQESVQQAKPDRQQVAANYIEKDFRRNLKQVMKTDTVNEIVNIYRGIDGFTKQAMVNMFWTEIKEKYTKAENPDFGAAIKEKATKSKAPAKKTTKR